ncbi:MAG: histidine kinase dimerization/phospho-acceptor domain-containing protein, partial [Planctomycetota bacterium]
NQRADDLAQRRLGDEERWWLAARDTLSRRINQRADELMAWPLDAQATKKARLRELEDGFGRPDDAQSWRGTVATVYDRQGQRLFPQLSLLSRVDDTLGKLELKDRQGIRRSWGRLEAGEFKLDANLSRIFLDAESKNDLVALTSYFRCLGRRVGKPQDPKLALDEWTLLQESGHRLPTTLRLNLMDRVASDRKDARSQRVSAQLILEIEGLGEADPVLAKAWLRSRTASEDDPSRRLQSALVAALARASFRLRHRSQTQRRQLQVNDGASRSSELIDGFAGFIESDGQRTNYLFHLSALDSDLPTAPSGLAVRAIGLQDAVNGKLVEPGGVFGARRFDLVWAEVEEPTPWATLSIIVVSALALIGLGLGSLVALRSMERERDLLDTRAEFLAAVSHQLKTPVANLRLFAETLGTQGEGAPKGRDKERMLSILKTESEKLGHQLTRIMGVARLDAPANSAEDSAHVPIRDLVAEVVDR